MKGLYELQNLTVERRRRVAVFRHDLLQISETFIRDQVRATKTWEPLLVGFRQDRNGLEVAGVQREIINDASSRLATIVRRALWRPIPVLAARLKELQLNLVHAHFGVDATKIWPSVRAAGIPLLVTLHGYDINISREWWESGAGGMGGLVYPRRLLKMARDRRVHFVAVSQAIKDKGVEYGIPAESISVSYIGVDTKRFQPDGLPLEKRPNRILFVGRMVEKKAPLMMIKAYARVRSQVPDAELVMIGAGALLNDAKALANNLGVPVAFLGACESGEVLKELHKAKVFCLPSVTAANGDAEGLPISILEAQACGVPVVSSARGGAKEGIRTGITGFAVEEYAEDELCEALNQILSGRVDLQQFSEAALKFARERFDIRKNTAKLESIYSAFVDSAPPETPRRNR